MKKIVLLFLTLCLMTFSIGCFSDDEKDPAPTTGSIKIVNNSDYPVIELVYSLHTEDAYGDNRLTSNIASGSTFTLTGITPNTYDIGCMVQISETETGTWESLDLSAYENGVTIAAGQTRIITLTNSGGTLASVSTISDDEIELVNSKEARFSRENFLK